MSPKSLEELIVQQRQIVQKALDFVKDDGSLVYSTCSILPQENEDQLKYFAEKFNLKVEGEVLKTAINSSNMDGFFGVTLRKNKS